MSTRLHACLALLALHGGGCALTSKGDSVVFRYFTPERIGVSTVVDESNGQLARLQLRLGRVNSATCVKDRIAYRDSDFEIGYYDELRWSERPEAYVRRAAARSLFEDRPIRQLVSGPGPTLDIELNAFEELRAPRHAARVQLTWTLRDDQAVWLQRTIVVEQPLPTAASPRDGTSGSVPSAVAEGMAVALSETLKTMVNGSVVELLRRSSGSTVKTEDRDRPQ